MIDDLRAYAEMKQTGLPWLGDVPAHWDVRRIKTLLKEVDSRSKTGEERLLSLRMRQGLVNHIEAGGKPISPSSLVGYKIVEPGQVVMNRMRAAAGLFGVASVRGLVSPDYAVFEPKPDAFNPYLLQAFRLPTLAAVFRAESKGLGTGESGFLRLYTDRFGPIPVPYPPLEEQRLIVRFLDWHSGQVARLVRAKKALIGLLNEQKQAIIHRAVTRGLDPNAKLKPSGIPWLGDVPEGWEVKKLKYLVRFNNGLAFKPSDWANSGVPIIRIQNLNGSEAFNYTTKTGLPEDLLITKGDIVFSWSGNIGTSFGPFVWERDFDGYLNQHIFKLEKIAAHRRYFYYVLKAVTKNVEENTHGIIGLVHITKPELGSISVPLAPSDEQVAIAEWLDEQLHGLNDIIDRAQREIALIQDFRTRMIADVVTGKLDVRPLAASLPKTESQDTVDDLAEDEDVDDLPEDSDTEEAAA
jgi:type I restriction enzyme, S subunit